MNKSDLLEEGDIITIKPGMKISVEIPSMFIYSNRRESKELATTTIRVGDVLDNERGQTYDTKKFAGTYLVEKTSFDGGAGPEARDYYPDGYHIHATKLKRDKQYSDKGAKIEFYQSGSFNALITPDEIQAEGKMQKTWTVVEKNDVTSKINNLREDKNTTKNTANSKKKAS